MQELQLNPCTRKNVHQDVAEDNKRVQESSVLQVSRLDLDQHKVQSINFCASSSSGKVQSITELGLLVL